MSENAIDYFALLNEPRRPWLDQEALKTKFHELSAKFHPDRFHTASPEEKTAAQMRYAQLNEAYQCLQNPKERLAHLLKLESGSKPNSVQSIPQGTAEYFIEAGQLCSAVDVFLKEKAAATSPMLKVRLFEQGRALGDQIETFSRKLVTQQQALIDELRSLNHVWLACISHTESNAPSLPLDHLEQLYRNFSYLDRWIKQLHERLVQISW